MHVGRTVPQLNRAVPPYTREELEEIVRERVMRLNLPADDADIEAAALEVARRDGNVRVALLTLVSALERGRETLPRRLRGFLFALKTRKKTTLAAAWRLLLLSILGENGLSSQTTE